MKITVDGKSLSELSSEELKAVRLELKAECDYRIQETAFLFRNGDQVEFNGRRGEVIRGHVEKVNQKTIIVRVSADQKWKVTATLLRKVN